MNEPPERPNYVKKLIIANPIPYEFFRTTGVGQSKHQAHAGSYHRAMAEAGIELGNLIAYTSILPAIAKEITLEEGIQRITHGAEVKVIQAVAHVKPDDKSRAKTAGIMWGALYLDGRYQGGLVCESNELETEKATRENVYNCLQGLFSEGSKHKKSFKELGYKMPDDKIQFISETIIADKGHYGTALAALAFVSHQLPVIEEITLRGKRRSSKLEAIVVDKGR